MTFMVLLLVGWSAVLNVAAAWGCSQRYMDLNAERALRQTDVNWWRRNAPWHFEDEPIGVRYGRTFGAMRTIMYGPHEVHDHGRCTITTFPEYAERLQAGWPLRSMESVLWRDSWMRAAQRDAIELTVWGTQRTFPMRILWLGFVLNMLLYALVILELVLAPGRIRRAIRRRRGQCERCAYPIGVSSVCTECSAAVRRASSSLPKH